MADLAWRMRYRLGPGSQKMAVSPEGRICAGYVEDGGITLRASVIEPGNPQPLQAVRCPLGAFAAVDPALNGDQPVEIRRGKCARSTIAVSPGGSRYVAGEDAGSIFFCEYACGVGNTSFALPPITSRSL